MEELRLKETEGLVLKSLHKRFSPNEFQIELGRALFTRKKKQIFARCGRKSGKTESILYCVWRFANLNPGSAIYYITPTIKQGKEILWAPGRLRNFGPKEFIAHESNQELRLTYKNESFIKIEGSENYDNLAGVTPDLVIYDEFRSFHPLCHEVMNPNRAPRDAPLIIIGTPPPQLMLDKETPHQYVRVWQETQAMGEAGAALHYPSWTNDKCPGLIEWLDVERARLFALSQEDVWRREYGAEFVESSVVSIFPQPYVYDEERLVREREMFFQELLRKPGGYEWYVIVDPSSVTCFGVLFLAFDPRKQIIYVLDEIYEKSQAKMSTLFTWPRIFEGARSLLPEKARWTVIYDEASAWFFNEVIANHDLDNNPSTAYPTDFFEGIITSHKRAVNKEDGVGLLKDTFRNGQVVISKHCEALRWEIKSYVREKSGKIAKANDHLIDGLRYLQQHVGFTAVERAPEQYVDPFVGAVERSGRRMEQEDSLLVPELSDTEYLIDIY